MKKKLGIIIVIIVVSIVVLTTILIKMWPKSNGQEEVRVINQIEEYGYILEEDETSLHKNYFEELVDVLDASSVDEEKYAELVVKLFVSDFYNLDNKITKNNVGGIQYITDAAEENMVLKAKDTIYKYVENNLDNTRKQKLPIVTDIEVTDIKNIDFEYGTKEDEEAYEVVVNWTYKEDLGYQDEATIRLIHDGKKLGIAELE